MNLIVNARDAMTTGGPIVISASVETAKKGSNPLIAGDYLRLVVADQGIGMDAETLRRATEPFFTTKGIGKGTGLGLPMVHGMAQQLGGDLGMESTPGHGTKAVLWLPVADVQNPSVAEIPLSELQTGTSPLTVLVADDDALVLMNTVALLEDLGHTVIEAYSGTEALRKFQDRSDIDLVVTDQAMPGMTGAQLIEAIQNLRPDIPVIIASGYGEGIEVPDRVERLGKPFDQSRLSRAMAKAMERR